MKKFKLRDPRSKKYFVVNVHENLRRLRKAADRHNKMTGEGGDNEGILGVCHSFEKFKVLSNGSELISDHIGTIQLSKKNLYNEVIAHELVHAAFQQYRVTESKIAKFGTGCNPTEEAFAHIYGRLFRDMNKKLYKHKLWGNNE